MKTTTSVPLRGLAFGDEFAYVAKADAKRKAAERRHRRKLSAENPTVAPESAQTGEIDDFDDENDGGGFDFGGDDDSVGDGDGFGNQTKEMELLAMLF